MNVWFVSADGEPLRRVLFLCSRNRRRSPTAERVFAGWPGIEVASAGLASDAEDALTAEALDGVDRVVVMERAHRARLQRRFGPHLGRVRVACLDIADECDVMDPVLVALLDERAVPHLRRLTGASPLAAPPSPRRA